MRFTTLLALWKQRRRAQVEFKTAENLETMFTRWREAFGGMEVDEIVPAHIEGYRVLRDNGGLGGSSLNKERRELLAIFEHAIALGEIMTSPVTTWERSREVVQREYVVLDEKEEQLLCRELADAGHYDLVTYVRFAIQTGLRQGTIRVIANDWYNEDKGVLTVPARFMKNRKQLRIPLSDKAKNCLVWPDDILIPIPSHQKIHRLVREAAERAGLPASLSPHDFRRTWVARMRMAGADMLEVMRLGGWSEPTSLLNHYFGEVPEKRAQELINAI